MMSGSSRPVAELLGEARIGGALDRGHGYCVLRSGVRKIPVKSADLRLGISGAYVSAAEGNKTNCFSYILRVMKTQVAIYARVSTGEQTPDNQLQELRAKSVDLYLHQQGIDTTTAAGKAMFQMCGVFAEFERTMIRERVRAGLERARAQGKTLGRPRTPEIVEERIRAARRQGKGIKKIATELGIGVSTVQRVVHGTAPNP